MSTTEGKGEERRRIGKVREKREREETEKETLTAGILDEAWCVLICSTKPPQSKFFCEHSGQLNVDLFRPTLMQKERDT